MIDLEPLNAVPKSELLAFPALSEMPDGTILGNHALRLPAPHRVLLARRVRVYKHADGQVYRDTETAYARRYLASLPSRMRSVRREQVEGFKLATIPQYCDPFDSEEEWFYVDLRSAYQSIYQRVPWKVEYLRNQYLGVTLDEPMHWPFPDDWKTGRSSIVTMALPERDIQYIDKGIPRHRWIRNQYRNAPLVALVWDVLTAVARVAIDLYGARYVNLDCAVVNARNLDGYCDFLNQYGFDYRIKHHGPARIPSIGCWQIGSERTKVERSDVRRVNEIRMTMAEAEWLILRFDHQTKWHKERTSSRNHRAETTTKDGVS